jgi:SP family myo-inositol transporter-like MFS transporter 13
MAYETNSLDDKKDIKFDNSATDKIEDVSESENMHSQYLAELSGIEATAASKAAWLISITVSLGGLLFGMVD